MSKEREEKNIINLSGLMLSDENYDIEAVPYLNNNGDEMQDILSEVENNTKNLRKDFVPKGSRSNVIKINFNKK
ncbi:MAG: hypothetical protein LBB13_02275 [Rickettsiales bacterium]|jgi:hypothetical protein|nr:hypothetical protein [Rickettsiales bacterium]